MHVGIVVMVSKKHVETNPEFRAAQLLENKGIEVTSRFYIDPPSFLEKYPNVNPETNVVIYCGGVSYNTVEEFMIWYNTLNIDEGSL